eukprot:TRINITY_DN5284_c0_g1_i1.p1 TRINITY_DN5284_c0_g1~~TRINITY_DN5284_c0_g1_i1.p1  ORF type:complete len:208 (+),score=48.80 TRINITY_DN5284_c0_g1_i1:103-726(+)
MMALRQIITQIPLTSSRCSLSLSRSHVSHHIISSYRPFSYAMMHHRFYSTEAAADQGADIRKKLVDDMKVAMKSSETAKLSAIRMIRSKIQSKDKENGKDLDYAGLLKVLNGMITSAKETEAEMKKHGRDDLAEKESVIIKTVTSYLPPQLSRDELKTEALAAIKEVNATSIKDMGKVVGLLNKKLGGKATPQFIGEVTKEVLGQMK